MITLLFLLACGTPIPTQTSAPSATADPAIEAMRQQPIGYTRHGECRMECRDISKDEVEAILQRDGKLNPERTRLDGECPSHALEGKTADGQEVRIVFAACRDETRVVTAIDLVKEWPCDCL